MLQAGLNKAAADGYPCLNLRSPAAAASLLACQHQTLLDRALRTGGSWYRRLDLEGFKQSSGCQNQETSNQGAVAPVIS